MNVNQLITLLFLFLIGNSCERSVEKDHDFRTVSQVIFNALLPEGDSINYEIFHLDLKTGQHTNITRHPATDWACHSQSGTLYFLSDRDTCQGCYFLYRWKNMKQPPERFYRRPVSPGQISTRANGKELAVIVESEFSQSLVILDSSGSHQRDILRSPNYHISDPVFSPDGKWIVYRSNRTGHDELWICDEWGAYQRQLTQFPTSLTEPGPEYYRVGPPQWVPGKNAVSFTSHRQGRYDLYQISTDTRGGEEKLDLDKLEAAWHHWSPEGNYLLFDGSNQNQAPYDIYLWSKVDSSITLISKLPLAEQAPLFWQGS